MKTELWMIGKTAFPYLREGMALYQKRLRHYLPFEVVTLPDLKKTKNLAPEQFREKEGELVLSKLKNEDFLLLLDERGRQFSSVDFARFFDQKQQLSHKRIVFLIGGAYGFSDAVYKRANFKWSLSKLTFSHQMIRLFVLEQLYRAMTILRGEPYHNE
ncbi:MAG: 23S rRNA (pseudouridine(1915)-N(3))-methyltransferase RlmH [Bacteroidetes bacterium]|nr:MAG: 23S rRNA (pseudouridine(1915)-N(3))-methyltransferase RlmH [Bacteroidota bacterium]